MGAARPSFNWRFSLCLKEVVDMQFGSIVEAKEDAPYMITTPGTKWVVYKATINDKGAVILQVGDVPESNSKLKENLILYFKESFSSRRQRIDDGFKTYTVEAKHFKQIGRMESNRQLAKELLSKEDDIWEVKSEEKRKRGRPRFLSNSDLPLDYDGRNRPW